LHQALRDALAEAAFIREDSTAHPETAEQLIARLASFLTPSRPQHVFTSDAFRYLPVESLAKLIETGWIAFDKHNRERQCSECEYVQVTESSSLACSNCGNATVYVLPLNYSISALGIAKAAIKAFRLNGEPTPLINNHLYSLGFSDVSHKHVLLCVAHDGILLPDSIALISQMGGDAIVLHTGEILAATVQNSILFLPILNRMQWTNKDGFEGGLPKVKASNVAQKKGGQAKAQQYEEVKKWCRAKFQELRAVTPKIKTTKEVLCNDVAEVAVAEKRWPCLTHEDEADAVQRLFENLYINGWLKGLK
jgi:hypothetical protein